MHSLLEAACIRGVEAGDSLAMILNIRHYEIQREVAIILRIEEFIIRTGTGLPMYENLGHRYDKKAVNIGIASRSHAVASLFRTLQSRWLDGFVLRNYKHQNISSFIIPVGSWLCRSLRRNTL